MAKALFWRTVRSTTSGKLKGKRRDRSDKNKFQTSEKRQCVVTNIIVQMIEGCKNISLSTLSRAPVHKDPGQLHIFKGK